MTVNNNQLVLNFPRQTSFAAEDFMPMNFNAEALAQITRLAQQGHGMVYVYGAEGVGKSHLLHVAAARLGVPVLTPDTLPDDPTTHKTVVLDMLETASPAQQEKIFHIYNHIRAERGLLIVAGRQPANLLGFLPDLTSRLKTIQHIPITQPDQRHLELMLVKFASDRQLALEPAVIRYLLKRAERSPRTLEGMIAKLDTASLADKRAISIPFVKQTLFGHFDVIKDGEEVSQERVGQEGVGQKGVGEEKVGGKEAHT